MHYLPLLLIFLLMSKFMDYKVLYSLKFKGKLIETLTLSFPMLSFSDVFRGSKENIGKKELTQCQNG